MAFERLGDVLKFDLLPVMLFVAGDDDVAFAAAAAAGVPCMILDLEDAVAPERKVLAREMTATWVQNHGHDHNLHVRINGLDSPGSFEDLDAVTGTGLSGVVIPKLEDPVQVQVVDWMLTALEARHHMRTGTIELTGTIETIAGVCAVERIAEASPRLKRLVFGMGDFSVDAGIPWPNPPGPTPGIIAWSKTAVALASLNAGLEPPHDGVYPYPEDEEGLRQESEAVRMLGYWGKHAIAISQVAPILDVYRATEHELDQARRIVDAFAADEGGAAVDINPTFVNAETAARAQRLLDERLRGRPRSGATPPPARQSQ